MLASPEAITQPLHFYQYIISRFLVANGALPSIDHDCISVCMGDHADVSHWLHEPG